MKSSEILLAVLMLIFTLPARILASDSYAEQMATVVLFYEVLSTKQTPSVSDFFAVFGKDNEAELELILSDKFPFLDTKKKWFDNQDALKYVNKIYNEPDQYPSRFFGCIKVAEPKFFAEKLKRCIEFPPNTTIAMKSFNVITDGKKVVIQFSEDNRTIENLFLPDGRSIYSLIEQCKKPVGK
jgi:hypothetical protein